jgi:hypothetical protein
MRKNICYYEHFILDTTTSVSNGALHHASRSSYGVNKCLGDMSKYSLCFRYRATNVGLVQ